MKGVFTIILTISFFVLYGQNESNYFEFTDSNVELGQIKDLDIYYEIQGQMGQQFKIDSIIPALESELGIKK